MASNAPAPKAQGGDAQKTVPMHLALKLRARQEAAEKSAAEALRRAEESEERASAALASLARLQAEVSGDAQKAALQKAQVAQVQNELQEVNGRLSEATAEAAQLAGELDELRARTGELESAKEALERERDALRSQVEAAEAEKAGLAEAAAQNDGRLRNLRSDLQRAAAVHEHQLESHRQEAAKKSAAARRLISDKDGAIHALKEELRRLQDELSLNSPEDRVITEIAREQAKRDARAQVEAANRDVALQKLQSVVADKDLELAAVAREVRDLRLRLSQMESRQTLQQSGGVNVEYLKNILVQYLSFPHASAERKVLFPVLSTLLQFSDKDLDSIREGAAAPPRPPKAMASNARFRRPARSPASPPREGVLEEKSFEL